MTPQRNERDKCPGCGRNYVVTHVRRDPDTKRPCCGEPYCRAFVGWGKDQWEGKARMAQTRVALGEKPDRWDQEALRRFPNPRGWSSAPGAEKTRPS